VFVKIAFIGARGIPHGYSSAEQIALNVGKRLVARGHEFTVYCRSNLFEDHSPMYEGVRRIFLPTIEHKLLGQIVHGFVAGTHSVTQDFDVVHFQCLTNTYQSVLPWLVRRNIVINVDGQEWDNPKWPKTMRHVFFKSAIYVTLGMCTEIITDAQGMYDIYVDRYRRPSTIIEYGTEIVTPRRPEILQQYGLSPKNYYFVAARIVPSNQIDKIVEAFNQASSDKLLAIAGGGAYGSEFYRNLMAAAGDRVKFLGMISDQDHVNELYANAYGYLHGASLGGVNSALLRPLGAGCPALAYDTPFNREVLQMREGVYCGSIWTDVESLAAGIRHFDTAKDTVADYSRLSVEQIRRNFTWDLVADQYEVFYRGFLEKWPVEQIRSEVAAQKNRYLHAASVSGVGND
jgi:glycosyltransferase involved in cell wall biosynthesis